MRIVLDTNVLLAGLATHGLCEALLTLVYRDHVVLLSDHILEEVARHYRGKFQATKAQTAAVIGFLRSNSELVEPAAVAVGTLSDKDDLPILGTALAGGASFLVSGDKELLAVGRFAGIDIVSPRAFYDRLRGDRKGDAAG